MSDETQVEQPQVVIKKTEKQKPMQNYKQGKSVHFEDYAQAAEHSKTLKVKEPAK